MEKLSKFVFVVGRPLFSLTTRERLARSVTFRFFTEKSSLRNDREKKYRVSNAIFRLGCNHVKMSVPTACA